MIVNTDTFDEYGRKLYLNKITGKISVIETQDFFPSGRKYSRKPKISNRVKSNRKTTKGRNIYYQRIMKIIRDSKGKALYTIPTNKFIKHFSETRDALNRKLAYLTFTKMV